MNWCKLRFDKLLAMAHVSHAARLLHIAATAYSAGHLTDGRIRKCDLQVLFVASGAKQSHVKELVGCGLWEETRDGWQMTDFLKEQPSSEKIEADREAARKRKERFAAKNADGTPFRTPSGTRSEHRKEEEEEEEEEEDKLSLGDTLGSNGLLIKGPLGKRTPEEEAEVQRQLAALRAVMERERGGGS